MSQESLSIGNLKRRVCILTTVHRPFDTRIFHKQAKTLVRAGHDVTLIAQHDKNEVVDGVKIIALPGPRNRLQRMLVFPFKAFLLALQQRADIYHFHDPELLPVGVLLKLFAGNKKAIYDVHEDYPQAIRTKLWLPPFSRGLIAVVFSGIELLLARFLDGVITATDEISRRFPKQKTTVVKNYPLLTFIEGMYPKVRVERHAGQKDHVLIYAGGLAEIRGIYELVKALEFINEEYKVRLKLLGSFSDKSFAERVRSLKGFAKVHFLGCVPYEEVAQHLTRADIGFVLFHPVPNYIRAMPIKLFEYMAAELPVVVSSFPLWKEIVEGNECGLTVDPLNPQEIARTIECLLDHPDVRQTMGEKGRRAVLEKYYWGKESEKLLRLYDGLLKK